MTADFYPGAAWEPVSYIGDASLMSAGSLGWVEHVVVGNGDPHDLFEHAPPGNRRFSHLWFAKSGVVKQYQRLSHDSWAQVAGNDSYWSCETEGDPSEPLTEQQLDALARWHVWSGTADAIATAPGQRGIGTHQMGGAAWGGHACPGPIRAGQRAEILRRAAIIRGGPVATPTVDLSPAALRSVAAIVTGAGAPFQSHDPDNPAKTLVLTDAVSQLLDRVSALQADMTDLRKLVVTLLPKS